MSGAWLWWFLAIFIIYAVIAFIMSPPTFLSDKFFAAVGVHPKLNPEQVSLVSVNGMEITGEMRDGFIQEFNEANFLFHGGFKAESNQKPMMVEIRQGKQNFRFSVYIYGDQLEFLRHKKKDVAPYRIQSARLLERLASITEAQPRAH